MRDTQVFRLLQTTQANSLPEGTCVEFSARDMKATLDPPETKRWCLFEIQKNLNRITIYCFSCHMILEMESHAGSSVVHLPKQSHSLRASFPQSPSHSGIAVLNSMCETSLSTCYWGSRCLPLCGKWEKLYSHSWGLGQLLTIYFMR